MTTPKGLPIVISAPSGGGKSTIAYHLANRYENFVRSISCTTRPPRPNEVDGVDYFFVTDEEFKKRIKKKAFLEWAKVHEHYYGTPISSVTHQLSQGKDVILTIDPQGARALRKLYPKGVFIFLVPPSWETLVNRLHSRASEHPSALTLRIANARKELGTLSRYDYLVVNDRLEEAVSDVESIVRAEHRRLTRINKKDIAIFNSR